MDKSTKEKIAIMNRRATTAGELMRQSAVSAPEALFHLEKKRQETAKKKLYKDQPAPEHRGQYPSKFGQRRLSREEKT